MRLNRLRRRWGRRAAAQDGWAMIVVLGALLIGSMMTIAAFAATDRDQPSSRFDQDSKQAYAAAEAGIHDYLAHLNRDNAYWARCTGVPTPNAVNQAWNGSGADPRTWRQLRNTTSEYTIELLPANGATSCNPASPDTTMINSREGTFRIRATGRAAPGKVKRTLIATFRRRGFLDYLYFTDFETSDPAWYGLTQSSDVVTWASTACARYYRDGRASQTGPGGNKCTEIQFAPNDIVAGPLHTNDELLVCGSPDFGRNTDDRIEVSAPPQGWRGSGNCSGNNPSFIGTWAPSSPILTLPPSGTSLKNIADPGYRFTGATDIVLGTSSMTVNGTSMALPPKGIIYVANGTCGAGYEPLDPYSAPAGCGDVTVHGTYGANLTIAAEKDVIIDGDLRRSGDVMLGLIANNFIRVYHPVRNRGANNSCTNDTGTMNDVTIDAAILSLQHSFTVDNYYCGSALGNLTVNGVIAQKFRGPVGRGNGNSVLNGYTKRYNYDDRLRYRSPPNFLDPVQSAWRIVRYTEQLPPL
ncbi:MAG: hypothetical protein U0R70_16265 [Solirubrobacteraceae bacterium]